MLAKMESTVAVMLLFLCVTCLAEISANTNTADNTDSTIHLNSDFNELTSNELSAEIDNCHEACLQKVCIPIFTRSLICVLNQLLIKGGFQFERLTELKEE